MAERIAKGWGIPEILEFDEGKVEGAIRIQDLFECLPFKGQSKEARGNLFRGYLTGAISQLYNRRVTVLEDECIAKGDPYCKFSIK